METEFINRRTPESHGKMWDLKIPNTSPKLLLILAIQMLFMLPPSALSGKKEANVAFIKPPMEERHGTML
jgi:hypothetical protein